MLVLGRRCKTHAQARVLLESALADGSALRSFRRMVEAQGGDVGCVDDVGRLPRAKARAVVTAAKTGFVTAIDAFTLGTLAIELGAGRTRADKQLDHSAGFELHATVGDRVARGAPLATIHAANSSRAARVSERAARCFQLARRPKRRRALVLERIR
jgi:pyrimidine-nucleoside phosphorylase